MTGTIIIRITEHNGEIMMSPEALALIFGASREQIQLAAGGYYTIPGEMVKNGKRRTREAFAAVGDEDIWKAMEYWAAKDHDAAVEFVVQGAL